MPVPFISSNELDFRLLRVDQQDKRFHILALCVPLARVTHFGTLEQLSQIAENNSLAILSKLHLATLGLKLPSGKLLPLPKCNPDAKYRGNIANIFCLRMSVKTGFLWRKLVITQN